MAMLNYRRVAMSELENGHWNSGKTDSFANWKMDVGNEIIYTIYDWDIFKPYNPGVGFREYWKEWKEAMVSPTGYGGFLSNFPVMGIEAWLATRGFNQENMETDLMKYSLMVPLVDYSQIWNWNSIDGNKFNTHAWCFFFRARVTPPNGAIVNSHQIGLMMDVWVIYVLFRVR